MFKKNYMFFNFLSLFLGPYHVIIIIFYDLNFLKLCFMSSLHVFEMLLQSSSLSVLLC